jgi:hypothetical protein
MGVDVPVELRYLVRIHRNGSFEKGEYPTPLIDFRIADLTVILNDLVKIVFKPRIGQGDPRLDVIALLVKGNAGGISTPVNQLFEHINQVITEISAVFGDKSCYSTHDVPLLSLGLKRLTIARCMIALGASCGDPVLTYNWNE